MGGMDRTIFIFIDGCGVSRDDASNPFFLAASRHLPFWKNGMTLPDGTPIAAIDATLDHEFILYEYFQTDIYAHRRPLEECVSLIRGFDALIGDLLSRLDKKNDTLVLASDHGNLEDYPVRGHSRNPVPLIAWGQHGARLRKKIKSISDVTPALLELFP